MAQFDGAVSIPIDSYESFKNATLGNGYNIDYAYGNQCWDFGAEFWYNTGNFTSPYLRTGAEGYAYEIWTVSREINAGNTFDLIYRIEDVKKGDMIVLDKGRYPGDVSGHNAFADEDYQGENTLPLLGQNQVNPNPTTGNPVTITTLNIEKFLGGFRYKKWHELPPPTPSHKSRFPWFIYTNKLKQKRFL